MTTSGWDGQRVLVTGAAGFIGSHLVEALAREGADVRAMVRYSSTGAHGWLASLSPELAPRVEIVASDIRDPAAVDKAVEGCSVVFHLAALISIPYSYEAPESYVDVNVKGTLNALQSCRRFGGVKLVQTSTSEVYGTPTTVPITEDHPLRAQSPYSASKIAADKLCESFHLAFEQPVVILRPFNTYGPRQSARAVLPTILSQLLAGKREISLGALTPRRDLTFVDDTVAGFLAAARSDVAVGRTVQLGTGRDVSIGELAELAMKVVGREARVVSSEQRMRPAGSEVQRLLSSPVLARELLGWEPRASLEQGIEKTAEWIGRHPDAYRVHEYSI